jgi:F-type H+-transporting ATPase subunit b
MLKTNALASEGDSSFFTLNFLWSVINFLLLLYVLYYFNKKSLHFGDFIKNRRAKLEKDVEEATRQREEAERRYKELVARRNNIEKEIETIRSEAISQMEVQKREIEDNARTISERIKKETSMIVEAEIARLKKEIKNEIIDIATKKAIEIIKEKFSKEDQERLENEFVTEVKKRIII